MTRGPFRMWRERGGRIVRLALPFADIMEVALALLALTPAELASLEWTFEDRKRLLDHFLASGKQAQKQEPDTLDRTMLILRLPVRDIRRLLRFAQRDLPKRASRAAVIDRLGKTLGAVL